MDRVQELSQCLRALQVYRRPWEPGGGPEYTRFVEELFSFSVLYELCDVYLDTSTTPEQRQSVRGLGSNNRTISGRLFAYVGHTTMRLKSTGEVRWLRSGLAAASIEDLQLDSRDTIMLLGHHYLTAHRVGIDPLPHFHYVATISNEEPRSFAPQGMSALLHDFHLSAYFLASVKPQIARALVR